jgi:hypothetical protein
MKLTFFYFNGIQRKELSKAFFNLGNIIIGSLVVNQVVTGALQPETFIFSVFCFVTTWVTAIILLIEGKE